MIGIIDYGAGNLFSIKNVLDYLKTDSEIIREKHDIERADRLILPGVGAFPDAMRMLEEKNFVEIIKRESRKKYILGICLGMQILFEKGYEFSETQGLGLIEGRVEKLTETPDIKIPHMGWSSIRIMNTCPIADGIKENDSFYFVHSYKAVMKDSDLGLYCRYGQKIPALVWKDNVFGCQFHPEKSGEKGIRILKNFAELK